MPGEPFGVPEATAEEGEGPDGDDGDGEGGERGSFGGAEQQPGGGGHEGEGGEFGAGAEEGGAKQADRSLVDRAQAFTRPPPSGPGRRGVRPPGPPATPSPGGGPPAPPSGPAATAGSPTARRLRPGVQPGRRLVQQHQPRGGPRQRPRQADPLPLTRRQHLAQLAHRRGEPAAASPAATGPAPPPGPPRDVGRRQAQGDVRSQRSPEQRRPLRNPGHVGQPLRRASDRRSTPSTSTRPEVGGTNPSSTASSVLFPDPLGPTTASRAPAGTVKSTSDNAGTPP